MSNYIFSKDVSKMFALMSGDYNPIHLDGEVARRTYFGETIVHGIHLLLQGCEHLCADLGGSFAPKQIKTSFNKPVATGSTVDYSWEVDSGSGIVRMKGVCKDKQVFRAIFHIQSTHDAREKYASDSCAIGDDDCNVSRLVKLNKPMEWDESQLHDLSGKVILDSPFAAGAEKLFPHICELWPRNVLHGLLFTTNIVGMYAPGLYSVFSNLDITYDYSPTPTCNINVAEYKVVNVHPTIHRCEILAAGANWHASLQAFIRPKPCVQLPYAEIRSRLIPGMFFGQKALVLGGSRGLGEVTSKILAAGGAEVVLTYAVSRNSAERIVDEINREGGISWARKFDLDDQIEYITGLLSPDWYPTHLYYFVTPPIAGDRYDFSERLFDRYVLYYVTVFSKLISSLRKGSSGLRSVLWPSSVAVTEVPSGMVEYAMAKSAGEILCASIMRNFPDLNIYMPRLPRIRTDLTANPLAPDGIDAVDILLPILKDISKLQ